MGFFGRKNDSVIKTKNWYSDRYQSVVVQRNLMIVLTLCSLVGIMVSVFAVMEVTVSKSIEPFVIEIEEKTGITNVIRPFVKEKISSNETIKEYFIVKYLNARETYNFYDFEYKYFTVVRYLSDRSVYARFKAAVSAENPGSPIRYGDKLKREIKIKYISFLPKSKEAEGFIAQVNFVQQDIGGRMETRHKVATINFDFQDKAMTIEQRYINPLGFQVLDYSVVDENLVRQ